eukprot:9503961-Pyramimonas_sp.AAC.1
MGCDWPVDAGPSVAAAAQVLYLVALHGARGALLALHEAVVEDVVVDVVGARPVRRTSVRQQMAERGQLDEARSE